MCLFFVIIIIKIIIITIMIIITTMISTFFIRAKSRFDVRKKRTKLPELGGGGGS